MTTPTDTPTPRTDAQAQNYEASYGTNLAVTAHFARTLERELAEARQQLATANERAEAAQRLAETAKGLLDAVITERDGIVGGPLAFRDTNLQFTHVEELYHALTHYHTTRNDEGK